MPTFQSLIRSFIYLMSKYECPRLIEQTIGATRIIPSDLAGSTHFKLYSFISKIRCGLYSSGQVRWCNWLAVNRSFLLSSTWVHDLMITIKINTLTPQHAKISPPSLSSLLIPSSEYLRLYSITPTHTALWQRAECGANSQVGRIDTPIRPIMPNNALSQSETHRLLCASALRTRSQRLQKTRPPKVP